MNPLAIGAAVGLGLLALFAGSGKSKEPGAPGGEKTPARKGRETAAEAYARGQREAAAKAADDLKAAKAEQKRIGKLVDRELFRRGVNKPAGKVADLGDDDDDTPAGDPPGKEPKA